METTTMKLAGYIALSFFAKPAFAENFHFYIYNECPTELATTVSYTKIKDTAPGEATVDVPSGHQVMVAISNIPQFKITSTLKDGSRKWQTLELRTSVSEYTHVLSCDCSGASCPIAWPSDQLNSRQFAK